MPEQEVGSELGWNLELVLHHYYLCCPVSWNRVSEHLSTHPRQGLQTYSPPMGFQALGKPLKLAVAFCMVFLLEE